MHTIQRSIRGLLAILIVLVVTSASVADSVTPLNSSFTLQALSDAGAHPVGSYDSMSQGSTINPLNVTVSATSTNGGASVQTTATGAASWISASQGQVNFTNVGWTVRFDLNGSANLDFPPSTPTHSRRTARPRLR